MPDEKSQFHFDFSSIEFPSDRITLGQIRRMESETMTSNRRLIERHPSNIEAINACRMEHILARKAWATTVGLADPDPSYLRREEVDNLSHIYRRYGIAGGKRETNELIRRFEAEVERVARLSTGEGRG